MSLYYSPNCPNCMSLFENYNVDRYNCINIHKNNIPTYIQTVPTIVVGSDMYVGNNALLYLQDNIELEPCEYSGKTRGGFSFVDDDTCKYMEQKSYTALADM